MSWKWSRAVRTRLRSARAMLAPSPVVAAPTPAPQPSEGVLTAVAAAAKPDTFCVHPWTQLRLLSAEGTAQVCCRYNGGAALGDQGVPVSLHERPLDDAWNSDEMRDIRAAMVEGRRLPGCAECYKEEKGGGFSMRMRDNEMWAGGWLNEERLTIDGLKTRAIADNYRLRELPGHLEVDTGSLCNLKCRMCHGGVSSRIAVDPVHGRWTVDGMTSLANHDPDAPYHPAAIRRWRFGAFLEDQMLHRAREVKRIYFIGGEPLLVKEIGPFLQKLIDAKAAGGIKLAVVTNGTITGSWLEQATQFQSIEIAVSLDGFAQYYDYIRYPASWNEVTKNVKVFQKLPNVSVGAAVTLQFYNALNIVELFRYLDSIKTDFFAYPIHAPRYLSIDALPPNARRLAEARLREYAESDCRPHLRDLVLGLASQLAPRREAVDPRLLQDTMAFTNDLDLSRGQKFREVHGELVQLLAEAGHPWSDARLHASGAPVVLMPTLSRTAPQPASV